MRTLAVDLGTRRIGLALSDPGGRLATPYDVAEVSSPQQATAAVLRAIAAEDVARLVVGVPLNMDGTIGPSARRTLAWAQALSMRASLPLVLVDERLSTFEAQQQLAGRRRLGERMTRGRRKRRLDALAAAGFLQAFLDGRLASLDLSALRGTAH
jgi:putative Holliday junction resolvase